MYPSPKVSSGDKHVSWHVSQSDVGRLEEAPTLFALPWMIQCDRLLIPTFGRVLGYLLWKALLSSGFVRPRISNLAVKEQNMEATGRLCSSRGASTVGLSTFWGAWSPRWTMTFPANEVPPCNFNPLLAEEHRRRAWAKWISTLTESHHSFTQPHFVGPHAHLFAPLPLHKHVLDQDAPWWF